MKGRVRCAETVSQTESKVQSGIADGVEPRTFSRSGPEPRREMADHAGTCHSHTHYVRPQLDSMSYYREIVQGKCGKYERFCRENRCYVK
jgi:hypothetical protein